MARSAGRMAATVEDRQNWFAPRIARHAVAEPSWPSTLASLAESFLKEAGNDELGSIYINNFSQAFIGDFEYRELER